MAKRFAQNLVARVILIRAGQLLISGGYRHTYEDEE